MPTTFLSVDKVSIAFGVSIKKSDKTSAKNSEAKAFARKARGAYSLAAQFEAGVRLFSAPHARNVKPMVVPGIAAFAKLTESHANENHAWIIRLPDNMACLQILEKRTPYSDEVMPVKDIALALTNKYAEMQLSQGFTLHITPDFDAAFQDEFPDAHELNVEDLLKAKAFAGLKMQSAKDYRRVAVLGVATVCMLGYFTYDHFKGKKQEEEIVKMPVIAQVDEGKEYEKNITQQLSSAGLTGTDALAIIEQISKQDTSVAGWVIPKVVCNQTQCTKTLEKKNGTRDSLQQAFSSGLSFLETQNDAVQVEPLNIKASSIDRSGLIDFQTFQSQFLAKVEAINQVVPITLMIGPIKLFGLAKNQKAEQIPADKQVHYGTFTVTGPLGVLRNFMSGIPTSAAIRTITIDKLQGTDPTFSIQGEYFVK